jgi:hypothetical protein
MHHRLTPLPLVSLCRADGHSCAACCSGDAVARPVLQRALRRQTHLFARLVGARPGRWRLLLHELVVRRGGDLLWGALLLLPGVSGLLRPWLKRRTVCAFLGFDSEERVGCLLHPSRWNGVDRRERAFALRPGFGCGRADYLCLAAHRFANPGSGFRQSLLDRTQGLDWFGFSEVVRSENALAVDEISPSPSPQPPVSR